MLEIGSTQRQKRILLGVSGIAVGALLGLLTVAAVRAISDQPAPSRIKVDAPVKPTATAPRP